MYAYIKFTVDFIIDLVYNIKMRHNNINIKDTQIWVRR